MGGSAPSGSTRFWFNAGNIDFDATLHDSLFVEGTRVRITGAGDLNRASGFRFVLWAASGATSYLRFRITNQSTGAVVYDSQMGAPDTAPATAVITNGWVEVTAPVAPQASKAARPNRMMAATPGAPGAPGAPSAFALSQNIPNPCMVGTLVRFTLPERSHLKLMVLDVAGRRVASLAVGAWGPGSHTVRWSGRTDSDEAVRAGIYFIRMTAGLMDGEQRFVAIRKMTVLN